MTIFENKRHILHNKTLFPSSAIHPTRDKLYLIDVNIYSKLTIFFDKILKYNQHMYK